MHVYFMWSAGLLWMVWGWCLLAGLLLLLYGSGLLLIRAGDRCYGATEAKLLARIQSPRETQWGRREAKGHESLG